MTPHSHGGNVPGTTEKQRLTIRLAQKAYMDEDWDDYDALVHEVAWAHDISIDDAYDRVENGSVIY